MDLEGRLGHANSGVAAPHLGGGRCDSGFGVVGAERPGRVVHGRTHAFDVDQHVGAAVLHGLEGADRTPELLTFLGVVDGQTHDRFGTAEHLRRVEHRTAVEMSLDLRWPTDDTGRRVVEIDPRELAGQIHRRFGPAFGPGEVDGDQFVAGRHDEHVGEGAVDHRLGSTRDRAVAVPLQRGPGRRGDQVAGQQGRTVLGLGQHGERDQLLCERYRRDMGAGLLEQHRCFDHAEPDTARLFGNGDPGPALIDHRRPQVGIEGGRCSHAGGAALGVEEILRCITQRGLVGREIEVHAARIVDRSGDF